MTDLDPTAAAADAVMTLIYYEMIINTRTNIDRITRLTGITRGELESARLRLAKVSYQPIDVHAAEYEPTAAVRSSSGSPATTRQTAPRPSGMKQAIRERKKRPSESGGFELYCNGHAGHEAHWAPAEDFLPRADRPHLRHVYCDVGRKSYLQARRVTAKVLDQLSSAGFQLKLDPESNLVGIACKECGRPFSAGDHIEGAAVMRHVDCETSG